MREDVIRAVLQERIIVIVRGVEKNKLIPLAEALYRGGIRLLEITFDASGKTSDEETAENIKMLKSNFDDRMYIGAGTVLKQSQVEYTKNAGGEFVISPDVNPEVIIRTRNHDMVSIPGALSPTEIQIAHRSGADFVKLFPITNMGTEYVKAVKAPLSNVRLLAVGGINNNNMNNYLQAGVCGFGVGANIVNQVLLEQENYKGISELAEKYVAAIKKL